MFLSYFRVFLLTLLLTVDVRTMDLTKPLLSNTSFLRQEELKHATNFKSRSKNRKFSFLLDSSSENAKNQLTATRNYLKEPKHKQANASDLITNSDIQVLQNFVKKLKNSVKLDSKEHILIQDSLLTSLKSDNLLQRKQNKHRSNEEYVSKDNEELSKNVNEKSQEKIENTLQNNNFSSMSKSDMDALMSLAKEWKRLRSRNDKSKNRNQTNAQNIQSTLQKIINTNPIKHVQTKADFHGNIDVGFQKQNGNSRKPVFNSFTQNVNFAFPNVPLANHANENNSVSPNGVLSKQLKETVDRAIANTTQQLLQFIMLEQELMASSNSSTGRNKDSYYLKVMMNLINSMRNSENFGNERKTSNYKETLPQKISLENSIKKNLTDEQTNFNELSKLNKSSFVFPNITSKQELSSNTKQRRRKADSRKDNKQNTDNQSHHYLINTMPNAQSKQEKQRQETIHKIKVKPTIQKEKDKKQNKSMTKGLKDQRVKDKRKKKETKITPNYSKGQKEEKFTSSNQGIQNQERLDKTSPGKMQPIKQGKYNKPQKQQHKETQIQSTNTSTKTEESEDNILKATRHRRLETMKNLVASLAKDPFDTWIYHQKSFDELGITPSLLKAGIVNLGSSKPMQHAVRKAVNGKDVKMLVVGGSISAGGGLWDDRGNIDGVYHRGVQHWWNTTITPATNSRLDINNVAIGGTDSEYFSYCMYNFVEDLPDIVIWELSANDYNRYNERDFDPSEPLEQLTRIILQLPSHPALIYVNFFRGDKQNFELGEKCPDSEETEVDVLSRYYDIPSLSWRKMVCNLITKRTFVSRELFSDDGYHPNLLGHAQVAMLLIIYVKGVFESVLADDLENMKSFIDILPDDNDDFQDLFQLKIPAFKDPLNPQPRCWTLLSPDHTKTFRNTLNDVDVLKGYGFKLNNVTSWDVRTDRVQCLLATTSGAHLDLSINVPVLDDDRNLPLSDAQTRILAIATHNKFGGDADIQLDELPSKTTVVNHTGKLKQTRVYVVSEDVRPGIHNLRFRPLSSGFCLTSIMVL